MNCDTCGERLDEYLAAELPADARAEIEGHLATCAACRAELEACRRIAESLGQMAHPAPGAGVCLRVSEAIHAGTGRPRRTDFGPVLDLADLAEYLRVDPATLEQYVGEIPCFELGGRLLFRKSKVEEWIASRETMVGFQSDWPGSVDWSLPANAARGEASWILSQKN